HQLFSGSGPLATAWARLEATLVRRSHDGIDRFWRSSQSASAFSSHLFAEPRSAGFYAAFPGLLTGLGLLCTFVAILVALKDVRIENNQVQGLANLISGLSGKFIASIAALLSASAFLFAEKRLTFWVERSRLGLIEALDHAIPFLAST